MNIWANTPSYMDPSAEEVNFCAFVCSFEPVSDDDNTTSSEVFVDTKIQPHVSYESEDSSIYTFGTDMSLTDESFIDFDFSDTLSLCSTTTFCGDDFDIIFDAIFEHNSLPPVVPQSGIIASATTSILLSQIKKGTYNKQITARIEVILAAWAVISEATTLKSFVGAVVLTLRSEFHESITEGIVEKIIKFLDIDPNKITEQAADERPDWLKLLKMAGENWQLAMTNSSALRVHKLVTMMVTLGICGPVDMKFGNLTVFSAAAAKEQLQATSFVDACFKTAIFLAESGYAAFTTNSFMPFLFSHDNAVRLDHEYLELLDLFEYAIPGNLERLTQISPDEFLFRLDTCIDETVHMYDSLTTGVEKRLIMTRLTQLRSKRSTYMQTRVTGGMREAPYAMFITGGSSLGKTDITDILYKACGAYNGIDVQPAKVSVYNSDDSYMSNYKSYMTVLKFDDFANTNANFMQVSPTAMLIKVINNVRETAVMADLADKGKISIEPKFVMLNGNVTGLDAEIYTNSPASVLRRGNIHILPTVKRQFRKDGSTALDSAKANAFYTVDGIVRQPEIPDLWDCTAYKVVIRPNHNPVLNGSGGANRNLEQISFVPIMDGDKSLENVRLLDIVDFCMRDSKKHFAEQKLLVARSEEKCVFPTCSDCRKPTQLCTCISDSEELEPQALLDNVINTCTTLSYSAWHKRNVRDNILISWDTMINGPTAAIGKWISKFCIRKIDETVSFGSYQAYALTNRHSSTLLGFVKNFEESSYLRWTTYVPDCWLNNTYVWSFMVETRVNTISGEITSDFLNKYAPKKWFSTIISTFLWVYFTGNFSVPILFIIFGFIFRFWIYAMQQFFLYDTAKRRLIAEHADVPELFATIRSENGKYIASILASFAAIYAMYKIYQNVSFNTEQGNLSPVTVADLDERDAEVSMWKTATVNPPRPTKVLNTIDGLASHVQGSVLHVRVEQYVSDAFLLCSNRIILPMHVIDKAFARSKTESVLLEFTRRDVGHLNSLFKCHISKSLINRVGNHDLAIIDCPSTGSCKNNMDLFPDVLASNPVKAHLIYRSKEGIITQYNTVAVPKLGINNGLYDKGVFKTLRTFDGSDYNLDGTTFDGMCCSILIADGKMPYIAGLHLGGRTGTNYGVSATVLRAELLNTLNKMSKDGISTQAADSNHVHTSYGIEHITSSTLHPKSPLNFLENSNLEILGSCGGRSTPVSRVEASIITDTVEEVTGVPNTWGPPKFKGADGRSPWEPWRASLEHSSSPSSGIPPHLLKRAKEDYLEPLKERILEKREYFVKQIKPLTKIQIASGIDGRRFVDSMNMGTSRGFPLSGPKLQDVVDLEPDEDHNCPRTFTDDHWKEMEEFEANAKQNLRSNLPFKAFFKDEPTPVHKNKVRVVQGGPMALQLATRKYFLPIARFLSQHPLISECAVGINAHGPEMDQLFKHIRKHGDDRGYAGDYSKYDLRMPAQMMYTAFDVMIDLAMMFPENYTEDDIAIMRVIATEIACAVTAFNGDFLQFIGSNPSGQSLTAYVNSIDNSLFHRGSFYAWKNSRMWRAKFRDFLSLLTYGDDYGGSVSKAITYNNIDFVDWCAKYDMIVTPPDKTSAVTEYLHCDALDFLKRRPRINKDLGLYMGTLDEASIFKSLHSNIRSKTETQEVVSSSCISSALSEWFLYGEEVYEDRRAQMQTIAERHDLTLYVSGLDSTYSQRVESFREKYNHF